MRECGECTMCCKLLPVVELDKPAGVMCDHCVGRSSCGIYSERPQDCKTFECMYYQMENVSTDLRPDKCGVIFEKLNDTLILGTGDPDRKEFPKYLNKQISLFTEDGYSVIMLNAKYKEPLIIPSPDKTSEEAWKEFKEEIETRHGCT